MYGQAPIIWQLSVIQFELGISVEGVALKEIIPSTYPDQFYRKQTLAVLRSYANKPYACKELFIVVDNIRYRVTTKDHGGFSLWLKRETVERVELYADPACKTIVPSIQLYPIYYPLERHPIEIISDLDDTVLRSYTNAFFRRVSTILFTHTERRIMVEFMRNLLIKAREMGMRAYCISRSEENLFHLVTNILSINHLNSVILYLFDYLNYRGLMTRRKKSFKFGQISSILQKSPERRYVLVGDDTQNDIQIYSEIAEQFYGRICSVLIHRTKSRDSNFQRYYHKRLANLKVPVWYFTDETPFETSILKH